MKRGWIVLIVIFLLAFSLRAIYLTQVKDDPYFYNLRKVTDMYTYDHLAMNKIQEGSFDSGVFVYSPLYLCFLYVLLPSND